MLRLANYIIVQFIKTEKANLAAAISCSINHYVLLKGTFIDVL